MSYKLTTPKRRLTYYSGKLETLITRFKAEGLETVSLPDEEGELSYIAARGKLQRLEEGVGAIETTTSKIEEKLKDYAKAMDSLAEPSPKDVEDFERYSSRAEDAMNMAFDYTLQLQALIRAFDRRTQASQNILTRADAERVSNEPLSSNPTPKSLELPTLPVPTFNGNIWEWDNFWELFNSNVHSQKLSEFHKFNYLLNALKGEALESVKKFQVTSGNYEKAIDFLRKKYGCSEELVIHLMDQLDNCSLRTTHIHDQRRLFEQVQVIIAQLKQKDENVNSQWLIRRLLSKFPSHIQRQVLLKKQATLKDAAFTMDHLLQILEDIITSEEMVSQYMKNETLSHTAGNGDKPKPPKFGPRQPCMYCEGSHKSFDCDKYATPRERSQYLREHKLCLICASPRHITAECKKRPCFKCHKQHHTSCCFQGEEKGATASSFKERASDYKENSKFKGSSSRSKETNTGNSRMKVNYLSIHSNSVPAEGQTVLEVLPAKYQLKGQPTYLPTGEITALDPTTKSLRKISVLLDTRAEISFIDTALAAELHLPSIKETRLRLHIFGSDHVHETTSREVSLQAWDVEGRPFTLFLHTHEILTKPFETAPICADDVEHILQHKLTVNFKEGGSTVKPSILIGCDQLWTLITCDEPHIQLPSGLHLLPTRLGYIMTCQATRSLQEENPEKEKDKWDGYWTLEGQVNVTTLPDPQSETDENEKWDRYWSLESAETEEFSSAEKEEQAAADRQV
ncbi:hypothetical protein V3C99_007743 [Haemonchus contortus]